MVSIVFGLTSTMGYLTSIEALYRPIADGPATNPLTALCIIFIGFALLCTTVEKRIWILRLLAFLVIAITLSKVADYSFNTTLSTMITPFQNQVLLDQSVGKSNSIGINSALMFLSLGFSLVFYSYRIFYLSQFAAFVTLAIPMISITGYAYGLDQFYGKMSMLTASTGIALSIATLAMTAHTGAVRAMLSPYIGGKIARLQTLAGYLIPSILGYLLVRSLSSTNIDSFGIYVITICWFIILMVSVSAIIQERVDTERREGERLLLLAAMYDNLTGLANRRKFLEFGQEAVHRAKRNKQGIWVLMLDIDFFKKINDTAGHNMGDNVLIAVSHTLKNSVREVDLVSRMGGEEFSIILIDCDTHGAERVAEQIRSSVENMFVQGWTDRYGSVTISVGCAFNDGMTSLEQSLKNADEALYYAKNSGRNQVAFEGKLSL
jgi:diguanylate cyclase (GGDEF)-like protein